MNIVLKGIIEDGYLNDKYGKHAQMSLKKDDIPYVSFPFEVENVPEGTKYLSWFFIDHDSNPVCAFSWIHWLVANYKTDDFKVVENLLESSREYVGGVNSYASPLGNTENKDITLNYGGPMPPDKDHKYTLVVCAHTIPFDVKEGFYYNDFLNEVSKKVLDICETQVMSRV